MAEVSWREKVKQRAYNYIGTRSFAKNRFSKELTACLEQLYKECNTSIHTVSILVWFELVEKGDLRLLLKVNREISRMEYRALNIIYKRLRDEYFKEFGFGQREDAKNVLKLRIVNLYCDMVLNDDHRKYSALKKAMDQLERMSKNDTKKDANLIEISTAIKKAAQVEFKINECSVAEFYGYMKIAEKQIKHGRK